MNFNDHLDKQLISMLYPLSINVITNPFPRSYETPPKPTPGFFLGISTLGPSLNGVFNMNQWPFQEPKLEVPTTYKAYIRPM